MISINPSCTNAYESANGWICPFANNEKLWLPSQTKVLAATLEHISEAMEFYAWSPFIYTDGRRAEVEFKEASFIGLDFDEGKTLEWALKEFKDYACVIGTTRNHQKVKGKHFACDRFRVLLKLARPIFDIKALKMTARYLIQKYGTDKACSDAARFFFPCSEIIFQGREEGFTIEPVAPLETMSKPKDLHSNHRYDFQEYRGPAVESLLAGRGFLESERNNTVFKAACSLASPHYGLTPDQAFAFIIKYTDLDHKEVWTTVMSAQRKALGK